MREDKQAADWNESKILIDWTPGQIKIVQA